MIVIDASFAVKLIIKETDSGDARDWFSAVEQSVVAPDLIAVEVAQAIIRRVNAREFTMLAGQRASQAWRATLDSGAIDLVRSIPEAVEAAADIAMRLGHPVKDCLYLALAIELDCELLTCDLEFRDKAVALYPQVRLLSEFS